MKMSITVEEAVTRMNKRQEKINRLQKEQQEDLQLLQSPSVIDYDHVSVRRAAEIVGLSVSHLYTMINAGVIRRYDKSGKTCVSLKEIEALNTIASY